MWDFLAFIPPQASTAAAPIDMLALFITAVTVFFSLLIALAILYFAIKYRRGNKVDRSNPPHEGIVIETLWTLIPFGIVMVMFVWSTTLYFSSVRAPKEAMEIYVVGKQWMWKMQHPQGRWEMNELHVPVGRPVKLTMTSEDVAHAFFVPAFRLKMDVYPGRYTQLWFTPTKVGTFHLFCAEFCGTNHSGMVGSVIVMEPEDYQQWLNTGNVPMTMASQGEALFRQHGCSGCHSPNSSLRAPLLEGIYGKPVPVQIPRGGVPLERVESTTIIADDRYIHDSIVLPEKEIAAGFRPIMPTFRGRLSEEEVMKLVAYIKSLSGGGNAGPNQGAGVNPAGGPMERRPATGPVTREEIQTRTGFTPGNMGDITTASEATPERGPAFRGQGTNPGGGVMGEGGIIRDPVRNDPAAPRNQGTGTGANGTTPGGAATGGTATGNGRTPQ
ncbi:MAG: cytochrome c oxidase subunit II [Armatimonadetes bacterium]|nr:cytochrome c oxidase subunit II [Armatimonadota bacterium]